MSSFIKHCKSWRFSV